MSKKAFTGALAVLLTVTLVTPAALLSVPPRAQAAGQSCIGGVIGGVIGSAAASAVTVPVSDKPDTAVNSSTAGSTAASCVYEMILIPLAKAAIRAILQQMTASVISFINGNNGTGHPSFVPNLSVHLQAVGDAVAVSFIARTATAFNSPFGHAISSSLQLNYNLQTSLAGFYRANQCTLFGASPNVNSFLAGNWSQGGVGAWMALTTQNQNNPYTLYQAALGQLGVNVGQAQADRRQDLSQSGGLLSWCGGDSTATPSMTISQETAGAAQAQCINNGGTADQCQTVYDTYLGDVGTSVAVSPKTPCTNPDGTPAKVLTPGSVVKSEADQALGAGWSQLISAQDIDTSLTLIAGALIGQVLGGVGGMLGASVTVNGRPAITTQLQNFSASNAAAASAASSLAQTTITTLGTYTTAWSTITTAANTASSSVIALQNSCPQQTNAVQTALANEIAPVISQGTQALTSAAFTRALANRVLAEAAAATSATTASNGAAGALGADTQALAAAPPSIADVVNAQTSAGTSTGARATPSGSLTVSGGTIVDQMNLISANADAMRPSCNIPGAATTADIPPFQGTGG